MDAGTKVKGLIAADVLFSSLIQELLDIQKNVSVLFRPSADYDVFTRYQRLCNLSAAGDFA
jgi:hypothetical protein